MKRNRMVATVAGVAIAGVAITGVAITGYGITQHHANTPAHSAATISSNAHHASTRSATAMAKASAHASSHPSTTPTASADPSVVWLDSAGGQAQVTVNDDLDTLAADLLTENGSPTVANHLVFEADARVVRAEAQQILAHPALLPTVNQAGYKQMLTDYIAVANLLQPGPGYGTTAQDDAAWAVAMNATNINVS